MCAGISMGYDTARRKKKEDRGGGSGGSRRRRVTEHVEYAVADCRVIGDQSDWNGVIILSLILKYRSTLIVHRIMLKFLD